MSEIRDKAIALGRLSVAIGGLMSAKSEIESLIHLRILDSDKLHREVQGDLYFQSLLIEIAIDEMRSIAKRYGFEGFDVPNEAKP